jgi:hypothetical protein
MFSLLSDEFCSPIAFIPLFKVYVHGFLQCFQDRIYVKQGNDCSCPCESLMALHSLTSN